MSAAAYPYLLLFLALLFYLRKELVAKLEIRFFPDYKRSFKIFHPLDVDFKCIHVDNETNGRCTRDISLLARDIIPILRPAILLTPAQPMLLSMLLQYSQLCHCLPHQVNVMAINGNIESLAKRWELELRQASLSPFAVGFLTRYPPSRRLPGQFPDGSAYQCSETESRPPQRDIPSPRGTATDTSKDGPYRRVSLQRTRSSCDTMSTDTDSVLSPPFGPYTGQDRKTLHETVIRQLEKLDPNPGSIYVFTHPYHEGFVKIGYSSKTDSSRLKQWKASCKTDYKPEGQPYNTPFAKRVESLIHADLLGSRCVYSCSNCKGDHCEWFKIGTERAREVVQHWIDWILKVEPYRNKILRPECVRWMFYEPWMRFPESDDEIGRRTLFLVDSNNGPWVNHLTILGKRARSMSASPEPAENGASTMAGETSLTAIASQTDQARQPVSSATNPNDQTRYRTRPQNPRWNGLLAPASPPFTPPSSAPRSPRQKLFAAQLIGQAADAYVLSPPSTPASPTTIAVATSPEHDDWEETPSKPKAARKQGFERNFTQTSNQSGREETFHKDIFSRSSASAASRSLFGANGDGRKISSDPDPKCGDCNEGQSDVISPLPLPSPINGQNDGDYLSSIGPVSLGQSSYTRRPATLVRPSAPHSSGKRVIRYESQSPASIRTDNSDMSIVSTGRGTDPEFNAAAGNQSEVDDGEEEGELDSDTQLALMPRPKIGRARNVKTALAGMRNSRASIPVSDLRSSPIERAKSNLTTANNIDLQNGDSDSNDDSDDDESGGQASGVIVSKIRSGPATPQINDTKPARTRRGQQTSNNAGNAIEASPSTSSTQRETRSRRVSRPQLKNSPASV